LISYYVFDNNNRRRALRFRIIRPSVFPFVRPFSVRPLAPISRDAMSLYLLMEFSETWHKY